jgi:hypothetical protein
MRKDVRADMMELPKTMGKAARFFGGRRSIPAAAVACRASALFQRCSAVSDKDELESRKILRGRKNEDG